MYILHGIIWDTSFEEWRMRKKYFLDGKFDFHRFRFWYFMGDHFVRNVVVRNLLWEQKFLSTVSFYFLLPNRIRAFLMFLYIALTVLIRGYIFCICSSSNFVSRFAVTYRRRLYSFVSRHAIFRSIPFCVNRK